MTASLTQPARRANIPMSMSRGIYDLFSADWADVTASGKREFDPSTQGSKEMVATRREMVHDIVSSSLLIRLPKCLEVYPKQHCAHRLALTKTHLSTNLSRRFLHELWKWRVADTQRKPVV